jgi:hypothetical protein
MNDRLPFLTQEALKMEIACFFRTLASANHSTWYLNLGDLHHCHHCENLKSHKKNELSEVVACKNKQGMHIKFWLWNHKEKTIWKN